MLNTNNYYGPVNHITVIQNVSSEPPQKNDNNLKLILIALFLLFLVLLTIVLYWCHANGLLDLTDFINAVVPIILEKLIQLIL